MLIVNCQLSMLTVDYRRYCTDDDDGVIGVDDVWSQFVVEIEGLTFDSLIISLLSSQVSFPDQVGRNYSILF